MAIHGNTRGLLILVVEFSIILPESITGVNWINYQNQNSLNYTLNVPKGSIYAILH